MDESAMTFADFSPQYITHSFYIITNSFQVSSYDFMLPVEFFQSRISTSGI
jgi:hypothetical protein